MNKKIVIGATFIVFMLLLMPGISNINAQNNINKIEIIKDSKLFLETKINEDVDCEELKQQLLVLLGADSILGFVVFKYGQLFYQLGGIAGIILLLIIILLSRGAQILAAASLQILVNYVKFCIMDSPEGQCTLCA